MSKSGVTKRSKASKSGTDDQLIKPSDISERLHHLLGGAGDTVEQATSVAIAVGAAIGTGLVLAAFLFGRRRGRRRSTLVEVVRV